MVDAIRRRPRRRPQRGFTMIELMLAMVVFAFGMLGVASLHVISLNKGGEGRNRGTAAFLAHSILDRAVAEGQVTAAERLGNTLGVPSTTTGWTFIGDASGAAVASGAALKFDINGKPIAAGDTTTPAVFTATWFSRQGTVNTGTRTGLQEFVVNVAWQETNQQRAISVSRYVLI